MIPHCHGWENPRVQRQWGVESKQRIKAAILTRSSTFTAVIFEAQMVDAFTVVVLAVDYFAMVGIAMGIVAVVIVAGIITVIVLAVSN